MGGQAEVRRIADAHHHDARTWFVDDRGDLICGICGKIILRMEQLREIVGEDDPDLTEWQLPKEENA